MRHPPPECGCQCGKVGCASVRGKAIGLRHGTKARYNRSGCRCDACRAAKAVDTAKRNQRRFTATADGAKRGQQWTGVEMEFALREDLTIREIAKELGRTYAAVSVMRTKCRLEPKYIRAVGTSQSREEIKNDRRVNPFL
jgi:hypothetical protein